MSFIILAAEEANKIFLPGDVNEFYWGSAAFITVIIFLLWKVRPPIVKMIKTSREKTQTEIDEIQKSADQAEAELVELRSKMGDMSAERERMLSEARVNAEELEAELRSRAEEEAAGLLSRAMIDSQLATAQIKNDINQILSERAYEAARRVILESLTPELQTKLLESYIEENQRS